MEQSVSKHTALVTEKDKELFQDLHGGYVWTTISKKYDDSSWTTLVGSREEVWQTKEMAILAARQRLSEGYAVEVFKQIAFSYNDKP